MLNGQWQITLQSPLTTLEMVFFTYTNMLREVTDLTCQLLQTDANTTTKFDIFFHQSVHSPHLIISNTLHGTLETNLH